MHKKLRGMDQVANEFDLGGRLIGANPNQPKGQHYLYDNNGNLKSMTTNSEPSIYSRTFTYDSLNRLTQAVGPYGTIDYQYDDVGNRTSRTMNSLNETYTYYQGTNLLYQINQQSSAVTYDYDKNGNTIWINDTAKSENWVLTWTYDNRLMAVAKNEEVAAQYVYNGFGQRVKKIVNGETTLYHYDFDGKLIAESDDEGYTFTKAEYIYRGQSLVAKVDYEDYSPTTISRYLNDQLGTPQIMTNENNVVVWEALYEPFGDAAVNYQSTVENNIRFPGQYLDAETGFHYNYHRYYDPRTGRYLSPDPIGQAGGINLYTYVENNPVNDVDPEGLLIDVIADIGFILWDIWDIISADNYCERKESYTALGLDVGGAFIPFVTGLGRGYKVARNAEHLLRFGKISGGAINSNNVLRAAENWLGKNYREIKPGVFRSADNSRQFRMTLSDLTDPKQGSHVHFESVAPNGRTILESSHVKLIEP